jgi:hypothetical protein
VGLQGPAQCGGENLPVALGKGISFKDQGSGPGSGSKALPGKLRAYARDRPLGLYAGGLNLEGLQVKPVRGTGMTQRAREEELRSQLFANGKGRFVAHLPGQLIDRLPRQGGQRRPLQTKGFSLAKPKGGYQAKQADKD